MLRLPSLPGGNRPWLPTSAADLLGIASLTFSFGALLAAAALPLAGSPIGQTGGEVVLLLGAAATSNIWANKLQRVEHRPAVGLASLVGILGALLDYPVSLLAGGWAALVLAIAVCLLAIWALFRFRGWDGGRAILMSLREMRRWTLAAIVVLIVLGGAEEYLLRSPSEVTRSISGLLQALATTIAIMAIVFAGSRWRRMLASLLGAAPEVHADYVLDALNLILSNYKLDAPERSLLILWTEEALAGVDVDYDIQQRGLTPGTAPTVESHVFELTCFDRNAKPRQPIGGGITSPDATTLERLSAAHDSILGVLKAR